MTFGYKGEIDNKKISIFTITQEMFKHYKVTISVIFTIMVIISAFSNLGAISGVFSILTVLLIYFKFIPNNIFESIKATNMSPLTSFEQAHKKCDGIISKPKTFFQNVGNLFDIKNGIGRELKNLNKKNEWLKQKLQ